MIQVARLSALTARRRVAGPVGGKAAFHKRDLVLLADQALARRGGGAGLAAADQKGPGGILQRRQALGDGRGGDVQIRRGTVEEAAAMDGGKGGELGRVDHGLGPFALLHPVPVLPRPRA